MKLTDYIIISRNGNVYKAKVELLSSIIAFYSTEKQVYSDLVQISSTIENTVNSFSDSHYSKSELKSDFCSKESIKNLTSDSTYALTSLANTKLQSLQSKTDVNSWCDTQKNQCWNVLCKEFNKIGQIVEEDRDTLDIESAAEKAFSPPLNNVSSELKIEVDGNEIL